MDSDHEGEFPSDGISEYERRIRIPSDAFSTPSDGFRSPSIARHVQILASIQCVFTKRGAAVDKLKRSKPMTLTSPFVTPVPVWICSNATSTIVRFASLPPHSVSGTTLLNKGQFNSRLQVVPTFAEK